ncbi:MAG: glycosyltransferase family 39 protein [Candidatus Dojkabacteria bacterium]|nr:glycosyltransferase family 39 protein [Candidatus Dojkabacteria bacterium]
MKNKINKEIVFLGIIILLLIILRIPSLFEPHWSTDEGNFSAIAHQLELGKNLYEDLWTNYPPGIFGVHYIANQISSYSLFALKAINLLFTVFSIGLSYKIANQLFSTKIGIYSALLTTLLLGLPILGSNIAYPENFSIFFLLLGFYFYQQNKALKSFFSGISFGLSILFNVFVIPEIILIIVFFPSTRKKEFAKPVLNLMGFCLPLALGLFYLMKNSILEVFFQNVFMHNLDSVLATQEYGLGFIFWPSTFFLKSIICLALVLLTTSKLRSNKAESQHLFVRLWLIISCFSVLVQNKPEIHLLIQAAPVFSIFTAKLLSRLRRPLGKLKTALFLTSIFVFLNLFTSGKRIYSSVNTAEYYSNIVKYLTGVIDTTSYVQFFGNDTYQTYRFSSFLSQNYPEITNMYAWTDNPWLYKLYNIDAPSRYLLSKDAYHHLGEVKSDLIRSQPDIIIIDKYAQNPEEIENFLKQNNFSEDMVFENYTLYTQSTD